VENVTAYDIALIGGGFTIVGALIGAIAAYWLSTHLERFKEHREARTKFRAAFAPALALLGIARRHGSTHNAPDIDGILGASLLNHAAALEEFRVFATSSKRSGYQEAWENYCKTVKGGIFIADTINDKDPWSVFEENIHALLSFAETTPCARPRSLRSLCDKAAQRLSI